MGKLASVLSLILKHWPAISSFGASISAFITGIIEQIGWQFSIVLAYWAGLITMILCGIAIFIYKYIKLYFSKQEVDKEERLSKIRIAENIAIATDNSNVKIAEEMQMIVVNAARNNTQLSAEQVVLVNYYAPIFAERYKKAYNLSGDATCVVEEIFKEFKKDRPQINSLLAKVMKKLENKESVSLKLVTFINGITDGDLEIIKKQFSLVCFKAIFYYDNILRDFMEPNNLWETQIFDIKFNELWNGIGDRFWEFEPSEIKYCKCSKNNEFRISNLTKRKQELRLFFALSEIGLEFYNVIKDELDYTPIEYARKVVDYINKQTPSGLKAEIISVQANLVANT